MNSWDKNTLISRPPLTSRALAARADYTGLRSARAFIDEYFDQPLNLDQIARRTYYSRYHFLRLFRKTFHQTPHQYLTRKRIERAKELLAHSELSVTEICFAVGFESLGSFSARFHKLAGRSPTAYRALIFERRRAPQKFIPVCFLIMNAIAA